jgi:hypothetical protein
MKNSVVFVVKLISLSIIALAINLQSCKEPNKQHDLVEIQVDLTKSDKKIGISQLFDHVKAIKLETTSESILPEFNKILVHENRIYISTGSEIFIFSTDGKFINTVSKEGQGPGEYNNISDIAYDETKEEFQILDAGLKRVMVYDKDFNYLRNYNIGRYAINFSISSNGMTVFNCGNDIAGDMDSKIMLFDDEGLKFEYLPIDPLKANYLHFRLFNCMSHFEDKIAFTDAHNDTIYYIDGEKCYPNYYVNIGKKKVPSHYYERAYKDIADFLLNYIKDSGYAYGLFGYLESSTQMFFSYYETMTEDRSPYGSAIKYYVLYDKKLGEAVVSNTLIDDFLSVGNVVAQDIEFFSQKDGTVVYGISPLEFIKNFSDSEVNSISSDILNSYSEVAGASQLSSINVSDNPILFIATLK